MSALAKLGSVFWLIALIAGAVLHLASKWPYQSVADWAAFSAILILIYRQLTKVIPKVDFTLRKVVMWASNAATQWSLDVELVVQSEASAAPVLDAVEEALTARFADVRIDRQANSRLGVRFPQAFVAEVSCEASDNALLTSISVLDVHMGYRDSLRRLRDHLLPFIELVEQQVPCQSPMRRKYAVVVFLGANNPFYQHVTRDLPTARVDRFAIDASLDDAGSRLSITSDRISIVAQSLTKMQQQLGRVFGLALTNGD